MLKSWFISLVVLVLLALAYYWRLFEWLASGSALVVAIALVVVMLIIAFVVLGNPLKKN